MNKIIKGYKKIIFLLEVVLIMTLTGCKPSTDEVEDKLKERYGKEFHSQDLIANEGGYHSVCYPDDNPKQLFEASFRENGEVYYDDYVGAMIADYNAEVFSRNIDNLEGVLYVHGYRHGRLSVNRQNTSEKISEKIRNTTFKFEDYYDCLKDDGDGELNIVVSIYVFMQSVNDYGDEYDCFEKASYEIIKEYKERYDSNVWVQVTAVYVYNPSDYDKAEQYYSKHADMKSFHENEMCEWANNHIKIGFGDESIIPSSLAISKDEYIDMREEMR